MNVYSSKVTPAKSHTALTIGMVIGTLFGGSSVGVSALLSLFMAYGNYVRPNVGLEIFLDVVLTLMAIAVMGLLAMWVLFFIRRYRGAFIASMVPTAFAVVAFLLWVVVEPLLQATSPYNH